MLMVMPVAMGMTMAMGMAMANAMAISMTTIVARAMALVPIDEADGSSTTSLVVVGDQQLGASPQAWVELIELADTASIEPQYIAPAAPTLSLNAGADPTSG